MTAESAARPQPEGAGTGTPEGGLDPPFPGGQGLAAGVTRLGRVADTSLGRRGRDLLAAHELLWALLVLRRPPPPPGESRPSIPGRLRWLLRSLRMRLVTAASDACIEGFPRSANSFTLAAFRRANPEARVANHLHSSLQLRRAARLGIPCCALVREPLDAVSSAILMDRGRVSDDACLRGWIRFHTRALVLHDHLVVCRFEQLTDDPALAARRLNERFGTSFVDEAPSPDEKRAILAALGARASRRNWMLPAGFAPAPHQTKAAPKEVIRERIARNPLLREAEALHAALVEGAG